AGAPGGVEGGLVGMLQGPQALARKPEGLFPPDGQVAVRSPVINHGMGEAPLLFQPEIGLRGELRDRVLGEKGGVGALGGGLGGHRLEPVFAKVEAQTFALRPGAAGAIEAAGLVDLEKGGRAGKHGLFAQEYLGARDQSPQASSNAARIRWDGRYPARNGSSGRLLASVHDFASAFFGFSATAKPVTLSGCV